MPPQATASDKHRDAIGLGQIGFTGLDVVRTVCEFRRPLAIVWAPNQRRIGVALLPEGVIATRLDDGLELVGHLPPIYPEWLGERSFLHEHEVRFPYIAGEMARGIATPAMVIAMGRAGMLGFFGAAGLSLDVVAKGIAAIHESLGGGSGSWGANLIHSPDAPGLEDALVDLYLRCRVERVSASAFLALTPAIVRFAATGLYLDAQQRVVRRNHLFAKVSRTEIAEQFMSPAPPPLLEALLADGKLSEAEAALAKKIPLAEDITVEADSGGHTDNRPLSVLLPLMLHARDRIVSRHNYDRPIRIGAAGGLGAPGAVAAAFAGGAAYVMTGSVNQIAIEAGVSTLAKSMLAKADMADVAMAPSADMFELGVKVQVLKKGTMFPQRATRLYELYRRYNAIEDIPAAIRQELERDIFNQPLSDVWNDTKAFFTERNPAALRRAEADAHFRMALLFRWYLGWSSRWPISSEAERRMDFQLWCGPAIGAFNAWAAGSFLAAPENCSVVQIALNLLEGAATITRAQQLRAMGVDVPAAAFQFAPRPLA
ncbi:MAG: PfaD family polyunsaturated fatty acid/polyketide biosynthesis protein [Methylocella sp.]|jgi:PfaD family protein